MSTKEGLSLSQPQTSSEQSGAVRSPLANPRRLSPDILAHFDRSVRLAAPFVTQQFQTREYMEQITTPAQTATFFEHAAEIVAKHKSPVPNFEALNMARNRIIFDGIVGQYQAQVEQSVRRNPQILELVNSIYHLNEDQQKVLFVQLGLNEDAVDRTARILNISTAAAKVQLMFAFGNISDRLSGITVSRGNAKERVSEIHKLISTEPGTELLLECLNQFNKGQPAEIEIKELLEEHTDSMITRLGIDIKPYIDFARDALIFYAFERKNLENALKYYKAYKLGIFSFSQFSKNVATDIVRRVYPELGKLRPNEWYSKSSRSATGIVPDPLSRGIEGYRKRYGEIGFNYEAAVDFTDRGLGTVLAVCSALPPDNRHDLGFQGRVADRKFELSGLAASFLKEQGLHSLITRVAHYNEKEGTYFFSNPYISRFLEAMQSPDHVKQALAVLPDSTRKEFLVKYLRYSAALKGDGDDDVPQGTVRFRSQHPVKKAILDYVQTELKRTNAVGKVIWRFDNLILQKRELIFQVTNFQHSIDQITRSKPPKNYQDMNWVTRLQYATGILS